MSAAGYSKYDRQRIEDVAKYRDSIVYSDRYPGDDEYIYRHVILPKQLVQYLPKDGRLMEKNEKEWQALGVQQSRGWEHYLVHSPEPHILLFRRPKDE